MKCQNCGAEIKDAKVCEYCGSQISSKMLKEQEALKKKGCPKCGSTNIHYNREKQGEIKKKNTKQIIYKTVGVCDDCGKTWTINQNSSSNSSCLGSIIIAFLCLGFFPIFVTVKALKSEKLKKGAKIGIISGSWAIYVGFFLFMIIYTALNPEPSNNNTSLETNLVAEESIKKPQIIEVESVKISAEKELFFPGETDVLHWVVEPKNATDKELIWSSGDESIVKVDQDGNIEIFAEGETFIKATANNGLSDSFKIIVDGSKREMNIKVKHPRDDDNNIGDEWNYYNEVNGEKVSAKTIILSAGDELSLYSKYTESDDNPDIGEENIKYTVTEENLINGFDVSFDLNVTENGGKNSGKSAHFNVTYSFIPK